MDLQSDAEHGAGGGHDRPALMDGMPCADRGEPRMNAFRALAVLT